MVEPQKQQASTPAIDEEGFLVDMDTWSWDIAEALARGEVVGQLTEDHWKVIEYLRHYYSEYKNVPPDRMVAKGSGCSLDRINELFPSGVVGGGCRIAGIPRSAVCGKRYQCKRS
jgi:tRNA 2-thiouridine synthesizing protein E